VTDDPTLAAWNIQPDGVRVTGRIARDDLAEHRIRKNRDSGQGLRISPPSLESATSCGDVEPLTGPKGTVVSTWEERMAAKAAERAAEHEAERRQANDAARDEELWREFVLVADATRDRFLEGPPGRCWSCWSWHFGHMKLGFSGDWVHGLMHWVGDEWSWETEVDRTKTTGREFVCRHACHGDEPYEHVVVWLA
jgi:hypothetical protein